MGKMVWDNPSGDVMKNAIPQQKFAGTIILIQLSSFIFYHLNKLSYRMSTVGKISEVSC